MKLAAFRVVPAATLFDRLLDIRDYRMPIGPLRAFDVLGNNWNYGSSLGATFSKGGTLTLPFAAGNDAIAIVRQRRTASDSSAPHFGARRPRDRSTASPSGDS